MVAVLLASTKAAAANLVATAVLPGSIRAPLDRQDVDAVKQVQCYGCSLPCLSARVAF